MSIERAHVYVIPPAPIGPLPTATSGFPNPPRGTSDASLAMLFHKAITAANRAINLQVFASDIDTAAIALAPEAIIPSRS